MNSTSLAPAEPFARSRALVSAGILLALTAVFHLTGLPMAAAWLDGVEGRIVELLWAAPAVGWLLVAVYWVRLGWTGHRPEWSALLLTALLPLIVALPLLAWVTPLHPGGYMLIGASVLALLSRRGSR